MTDKDIIIDGVNVAGCKWCEYIPNIDPYCRISDGTYVDCKENPNCHYKQLHRKEREYEELKKVNIHIDTNRKNKGQKLKRIEDLIINCQSGYTDEFIQELLSIILENEPSITDLSIIDRYKQTLEKIEKVLWHYHNNLYTPKNPVADEIEKRIFDIINEVKE